MKSERLFLKAHDIESCDVISSLLQDSLFHLSAFSFHSDRNCLRLMLNRFCWETIPIASDNFTKKTRGYESTYLTKKGKDEHFIFRVHSGLYIHNITDIVVNDNFKKTKKAEYMNLLAMHVVNDEINLLFSDNKNVYIKTGGVCVHLKDLHDRYPSPSIPKHE